MRHSSGAPCGSVVPRKHRRTNTQPAFMQLAAFFLGEGSSRVEMHRGTTARSLHRLGSAPLFECLDGVCFVGHRHEF